MLGREPRRFGGINWRAMRKRSAEILSGLHLNIDPGSLLNSHSLAIQQLVAIARAIDVQAKVLILDEPTSSLDPEEVAELFRVIRTLKESGVAILFVSHFLDQVYEISDRHHGAAQRPTCGRVPDRGAAPHRPGAGDDRQGTGGSR